MPENTKKIIAKSEKAYRKFIIYKLGEKNFGIVMNGKLLDKFISSGEVEAYIDAYYAMNQYRWN